MTPLSKKLGLSVSTKFSKGEEKTLVEEVLTQNGVVLICWRHENIPSIANYILGDKTTAPQNWPDERYDLVWIFDLDAVTGKYAFEQVPQSLLEGDLPDPIK